MRTLLILLRKDVLHFRRDRARVVLTFVAPLLLTYLFGQIFGIDRRHAGRGIFPPAQLIGGWAVQFLLFTLVSSSTSLVEERDRGLFQRILSGPVAPSAILWSKFLFGACLGLVQLAILFAAGQALYGIDLAAHLPALALVCACAAAACSACGMLLASFSTTSEAAQGFSTLVILVMCALGGAWFPVQIIPAHLQPLSRLTLVYWAILGFVQVLWTHAPGLEVAGTTALLAGIAAAFLSLAWWRFNRARIFG